MTKKKGASDDDTGGGPMAPEPTLLPAELPSAVSAGYVVLARKYRPATFDDLIGQEAMVTTLRNAFAVDRIAQGYMLTGVRGVGKTTTARILARALNYVAPGLPDRPTIDMPSLGQHCREIMESRHPDVLEMDAASNTGVDNIREVIDSARYRPMTGRYKVFIIDEVHMLSKGAFNALLKTLEEPPPHVKFIFATTEIRKVPVTVLSRCQRFDLRRVDVPILAEHFRKIVAKEGAKAEYEALMVIARAAEGSVRDGLSVLDQAIATSASAAGTVSAADVRTMLGLADRGRLFDLLDHLVSGRAKAALEGFAALHRDGADPIQALTDLAEAVHLATRIKIAGVEGAGLDLSAEEKRRGTALASQISIAVLSRVWQMMLKGIEEAGRAPNAFAAGEMLLIRIAHAADLPSPEDIINRLGGGSFSSRAASGDAAPVSARDDRQPLNQDQAPSPQSTAAFADPPSPASPDDYGAFDPGGEAPDEDHDGDGIESPEAIAAPPAFAHPRTFKEVIELIGQRRDAKLKYHLEEQASLVKFDPGGAIELFMMPGAPSEIANDLREKLNKWTGRRWMVAVGAKPGDRPLGEVRREREAAELELLKVHPAVAAVLQSFPDARIASVKPVKTSSEDDQAAG